MARARVPALATLARVLAVIGGLLMLVVSLISTASVLLRWFTTQGIQGDFEIVSIGGGLAVFLCLPWAQARGANILVDSFTTRAPAWFNRGLDALWSLVYAGLCAVLAWRMTLGAQDSISSHTVSMVLGIPYGWAMLLAAGCFGVTAVVALATAFRPAPRH
jgi:TRAP-type C4-dicarboxylate transport system permease small subunit